MTKTPFPPLRIKSVDAKERIIIIELINHALFSPQRISIDSPIK